MKWTLVAFYKFCDVADPAALQPKLMAYCDANGICGSILLAREGLNGTMAGEDRAMRDWIRFLETDCRFGEIDHKFSYADEKPFRKLKVKLKSEIVHLGRPDLLPHKQKVGHYVEAKDWNQLISDPDVRVIDTRNDFECEVGTFARAENPHTEKFSEFPDYLEKNLSPEKDKKVAMFCTGGIRCEKATAFLLEQGFEEVYHLKGGILKYFEEVPETESLWQGECFVFDDRVTVDGNLEPGTTECCRGCWNPILSGDKKKPGYEEGVSCPHCFREEILNLPRHGLAHVDLKLSNLLVQGPSPEDLHFYWIDLEDLRPNSNPRRTFIRNLYQLNGSLPRQIPLEERKAFVAGFVRLFPFAKSPRLIKFVQRKTRRRHRDELKRLQGA